MFTPETVEMAWLLYQASLKHSSFDADYKKLAEESLEYRMAERSEDLTQEFTDLMIMYLRNFCYAVEPRSRDELQGYVDSMAEWQEFKFNRQMNERGWSE